MRYCYTGGHLEINALKDSVCQYPLNVIRRFDQEGILADIVQVGNKVNHGMLWLEGKI